MKKYIKILLIAFVLISLGYVQYKSPNNQNTKQVFNESKKYVALTFDDGPHYKNTKLLLDGLRERNVKATFFIVGQNIEGNEEILKQMKEDGHLIGNHTYSHKNLFRLSKTRILNEIEKTNVLITLITGEVPSYFRPSYGNSNDKIEHLTEMKTVLWNCDSLDWKLRNSNRITKRVLNSVHDGSIILMHDIYKTSVNAALNIIDRLEKEGYEFVTVEELAKLNAEVNANLLY